MKTIFAKFFATALFLVMFGFSTNANSATFNISLEESPALIFCNLEEIECIAVEIEEIIFNGFEYETIYKITYLAEQEFILDCVNNRILYPFDPACSPEGTAQDDPVL